jgi:hypothetical protein
VCIGDAHRLETHAAVGRRLPRLPFDAARGPRTRVGKPPGPARALVLVARPCTAGIAVSRRYRRTPAGDPRRSGRRARPEARAGADRRPVRGRAPRGGTPTSRSRVRIRSTTSWSPGPAASRERRPAARGAHPHAAVPPPDHPACGLTRAHGANRMRRCPLIKGAAALRPALPVARIRPTRQPAPNGATRRRLPLRRGAGSRLALPLIVQARSEHELEPVVAERCLKAAVWTCAPTARPMPGGHARSALEAGAGAGGWEHSG